MCNPPAADANDKSRVAMAARDGPRLTPGFAGFGTRRAWQLLPHRYAGLHAATLEGAVSWRIDGAPVEPHRVRALPASTYDGSKGTCVQLPPPATPQLGRNTTVELRVNKPGMFVGVSFVLW